LGVFIPAKGFGSFQSLDSPLWLINASRSHNVIDFNALGQYLYLDKEIVILGYTQNYLKRYKHARLQK
jgi:hypothetical protein